LWVSDLLHAVTHFLTSTKNLFPEATRGSAIAVKGAAISNQSLFLVPTVPSRAMVLSSI